MIYSLIRDAQSASEGFEEFCANCGYDEDSRRGYRFWETCNEGAKKLARVFTEEEIETLAEITRNY